MKLIRWLIALIRKTAKKDPIGYDFVYEYPKGTGKEKVIIFDSSDSGFICGKDPTDVSLELDDREEDNED